MSNNIQSINIKAVNKNNHTNGKTFKGAGSAALSGLRFLNESPAIGACAVDLASMVVPRTAVETKQRGPQSGFETFFREVSSCVVHACVGLIGLGAATAVSGKFNEQFGVKAQNIFASEGAIKNFHSHWNAAEGGQREFFERVVSGMKGLNGSEWKNVSEEAKGKIVDGFVLLADKLKEVEGAKSSAKSSLKKEASAMREKLVAQITKNTGAKASFKLKGATAGVKEISSSLGELTDNAVGLANTFSKKTKEELPDFVKALSKNKVASTVLGLGICSAICMSIQPVNRYLTKKRTGSDGFVGVEGAGSGDKSPKFKKAKKILGIGFPLAAIASIGAKPSELVNSLQFNSKIPTLNQFKLIYGLTIGSRFLAARDGNELREGAIKDTMGFANWLILGSMVSKLTARALGGKELINNPVKTGQNGKKGLKYAWDWMTKSSVKSFDEILLPKAAELMENGKMKSFKKLVKESAPETKSLLKKAAVSQVAGYLYSGLVLGVGISKLNIAITKHLQGKKAAQMILNGDNPRTRFDVDYLKKLNNGANPVFKDFE